MFSYPRRTWCAPWMTLSPSAARAARIERGARAQVAHLHLGAVQGAPAGDGRVVVVADLHAGAHPAQLLHPLEAVLEDRLVDAAACRAAWVSSTAVGGWRSVARPG